MKYSASTLAIGLLFGAAEAMPQAANKCSHNNCLRAVIAGSFPNRPTVADCSSFLRKTVTPAAYTETIWETVTPATETATSVSTSVATELTTVTVLETLDVATQTVTTTITAAPVVDKREAGETVHPTAIPTYATACRSADAYSSACSCIGVSPTTITEATPTVKVTSTSTVTAQTTIGVVETVTTTVPATVTNTESRTVTAVATATVQPRPWDRFILRASGGRVNGRYAYSWQFAANREMLVQSFSSRGQATVFGLDSPSDNALFIEQNQSLGRLTVIRGAGPFGAVFNSDDAWIERENLIPVRCSMADDWELKCAYEGQGDWFYCDAWMGPVLQLGGVPEPAWNCDPIKLYAEGP
ncbi:hypothetical protein ACHAQH_007890 [Verticillium albo-atrum]